MRVFAAILFAFLLTACGGGDTEQTDAPVASDSTETAKEETIEEQTNEEQPAEDIESDSEDNQMATAPSEPVEIIRDDREGITPERIEIPSINVDAPVEHLGLADNGEMEVPESLHDTAWYEPGYKVGEPGNSVIAGHVDDTVNPGVFKELHTLEPGDEIIVHGEDDDSLTFTVNDKELFDADEAPVDQIFGYSHRSMLNLITCEGPYDYEEGGTPNRWVIYTELNTG